MLNKFAYYLAIMLLSFSVSQCFSKCNPETVKDTTKLKLKWQSEPTPLEVPGLDLTQVIEGKTCYVPSEDATYLIDIQGNAWKFTRTSAGSLEAQALNKINLNLPVGSTPHDFFVFAAGSQESQSLFVGKLSLAAPINIELWKYTAGNWKTIPQPSTPITILFTPVNNCDKHTASCSLEEKDQISGCLMLSLTQGPNLTTGILVFDPTNEKFSAINPTLPRQSGQYPWIATSPAPNKLVLGIGDTSGKPASAKIDKLDLISMANNKANIVKDKGIKNDKKVALAGLCCLQLEENFSLKIQEPIFYALEGNAYKFFRADEKNSLVSAGDLPSITLDEKTLILPFSHELYCLTTQKEADKVQTIYYYAQLALAPKDTDNNKK